MAYLEVCAAVNTSLALRPCKMGYSETHGHDVSIEVCYCGDPDLRLDVEKVWEALDRALPPRGELDRLLSSECAVIEDLLNALAAKLPRTLEGMRLCRLTASWMWGSRRVSLHRPA